MRRFTRIIRLASASVLGFSTLLTIGLSGIAHAAVDTCTWTGAIDGTFSNGGNWTGCDNSAVPENGDSLVFDVSASANAPTNDMSSMSFANITFSGTGTTPITVSGNAFTITGDVTDSSNQDNTVGNNLTFTGTSTFNISSGAALALTGTIGGSGSLVKSGAGAVNTQGAFNLTGSVTDNQGQMQVTAGTGSDVSFSSLTLGANADFYLDVFSLSGATNTFTITKPITTAGGTLYFRPTTLSSAHDVNLTGTYTLSADAFINAANNITVHVQGALNGAGFTLQAAGSGTVINESTSNTTNTPDGTLGSTGGGQGAAGDDTTPDTPDTGFALAAAHPGITLAVTLASAATIFAVARTTRKSSARR